MKCWKNNFDDKTLKTGVKYKDNVVNIDYDGHTLKATVKNKYDVELIMQDNILFDMSCTCSKKSSCTHEAGLLYFLDEFPEILEDFAKKDYKADKIKDIDIDSDLKIISESKLKKFLKKEFKNNPKLKYNFIEYFKSDSLIDHKAYEKKLKKIIRKGKGKGFSYHGYYDLEKIGRELKEFIRKEISNVFKQKDYEFTYKLLNEIMDTFIDQIYWDEDVWYDIAYTYREYSNYLLKNNCISPEEESHMLMNLSIINGIII